MPMQHGEQSTDDESRPLMARKRRRATAGKIVISGASVAATLAATGAIASADHATEVARREAALDRSIYPAPPVISTVPPRIVVLPRPTQTAAGANVPNAPFDGGTPAGQGATSPARTAPDAPTPAAGSAIDPGPTPAGGGGDQPPPPTQATAPPATAPPATNPPPTTPPTAPPTTSSGGS